MNRFGYLKKFYGDFQLCCMIENVIREKLFGHETSVFAHSNPMRLFSQEKRRLKSDNSNKGITHIDQKLLLENFSLHRKCYYKCKKQHCRLI